MKLLKSLIPYIIIIVIVVFVRTFIITPVKVNGTSMYPTLEGDEIMLLNKLGTIDRFDIVVLKLDGENNNLIKRVIGLPGDSISIKDGTLYINGEVYIENYLEEGLVYDDFELTSLGYQVIPDDMYFVLGDNRADSVDSREIGLVSKDDIIGKISFRIWPLNKLAVF